MKKKLLVAGMSVLFACNVLAGNSSALTKEEMDNRNREMLSKAGIEIPSSTEISIVSANKYMGVKGIKQNANDAHMTMMRRKEAKKQPIQQPFIQNQKQ